MAHQPMHVNHWIEIDKEYQWYLDEKARVIREKGDLSCSPGTVAQVFDIASI